MTHPSHQPELNKQRYQIIVSGRVERWAADRFDCLSAETNSTQTTLTVSVSDQTELHGILSFFRDYNFPLLLVRQLQSNNTHSY